MKSQYRLGHPEREVGEWEVYNSRYAPIGAYISLELDKPWVAFHPDQNVFNFVSQPEAIRHINKVEDGDIW